MATSGIHGLAWLDLVFVNDASGYSNVGSGDISASTTAGSLYVRLYTADVIAGGDPTVNEATYDGYNDGVASFGGVATARNVSDWQTDPDSIGAPVVENVLELLWGEATGASGVGQVITHAAVCTTQNGPGEIIVGGPLAQGASLTIQVGSIPRAAPDGGIRFTVA